MIDVLKKLEQISSRSPEEIGRAIDNVNKLVTPPSTMEQKTYTNIANQNKFYMVDVLSKLQEISNRSPDEVGRAIDSVSKLNNLPVSESVKIDLSGEDAVLGQILKLAGMINAETSMTMASDQPVAPMASIAAPVSSISATAEPSMTPEPQGMDVTMDSAPEGGDPTDRPYNNSPHEVYKGTRAAVPSGTDLARPKGSYPKVAGGDNPTHVAVDFD